MHDVLADFLSEEALAKQLGHHQRTMARWRRQGRGPSFVLNGRSVLYHVADVSTWLRAGGALQHTTPNRKRRKERHTRVS
jgi:hypothetical protein